jgi:HEAT repeat protein
MANEKRKGLRTPLSDDTRSTIVDTLTSKTRHKETDVRRAAAKYLSFLGETAENMIELYIGMVQDAPHSSDRQAGADALIRMGEPAVEQILDELVNHPEDNEYYTMIGMEILGKMAMIDEAQKEEIKKEDLAAEEEEDTDE